ncbi:TPA: hypothetical protein ACGQK4_002195 [Elizabethkingia anophelis]|nr:hypothetical protein [Elizabethkingia anophelis]
MKNADKPVYPSITKDSTEINGQVFSNNINHSGLTKREYFAGLAMQGIVSNQTLIDALMQGADVYDSSYTSLMINRVSIMASELSAELLMQLD